MDEQDYVYDGEYKFTKEEYINVVYPQMKAASRSKIKMLQGEVQFSFMLDNKLDEWSENLLFEVVP